MIDVPRASEGQRWSQERQQGGEEGDDLSCGHGLVHDDSPFF